MTITPENPITTTATLVTQPTGVETNAPGDPAPAPGEGHLAPAPRKPQTPVVAAVGAVRIQGPNAKGYYRLKWTEPDGRRGDTSGSNVLQLAMEKATEIDERVAGAAGPRAVTALAEVMAAYLAAGHSPYAEKRPWKSANRQQVTRHLDRCLRGYESLRCMDVDRDLCDRMRAQAGTPPMVRANTVVIRSFLVWGQQNGYFSGPQAELLPRNCSMPAPSIKRSCERVDAGDTSDRARMNGQDEDFVRDEDAPSRSRVVALSASLAEQFPLWGELAPELAASTGLRWGEQFQLMADDVHLQGCIEYEEPHIHIDWQVDAGGDAHSPGDRRVRPKGDKTRVIGVDTTSFTGFALRKGLKKRVKHARKEQRSGTNPQALLFPAQRGGLLWYSSFNADHLLPAMEAAGWPVQIWNETRDKWDAATGTYTPFTVLRRKAEMPWHSLRHRFARTAVDMKRMPEGELMAVGGWENISTVQTRYYRSGQDNMQRGLRYFT